MRTTRTMVACFMLCAAVLIHRPANAAISFATNGDDLEITFTEPLEILIDFSFHRDQLGSNPSVLWCNYCGFLMHDLLAIDGPDTLVGAFGDFLLAFDPPRGEPTYSMGGIDSRGWTTDGNEIYIVGLFNGIDNATPILHEGDIVTIIAGTVTLDGYIAAGGILPDPAVDTTDVELVIDSDFIPVSLPVTVNIVPEPNAAIFLCGLMVTMSLSKRRRCGYDSNARSTNPTPSKLD